MSIEERQKPREGSAFATYAHQRQPNKRKPVVFWALCLIAAVSFWGWLYSSAFAKTFKQKDAEQIMIDGEIIARKWESTNFQTYVIYKKRLYYCGSYKTSVSPLQILCHNID